jgi:hypothetical protein
MPLDEAEINEHSGRVVSDELLIVTGVESDTGGLTPSDADKVAVNTPGAVHVIDATAALVGVIVHGPLTVQVIVKGSPSGSEAEPFNAIGELTAPATAGPASTVGGRLAGAAGVTLLDGDEAALVPITFLAVTVKV